MYTYCSWFLVPLLTYGCFRNCVFVIFALGGKPVHVTIRCVVVGMKFTSVDPAVACC